MKKKIIYTNEPPNVDLDNAKRIKDFLPPPHELVFKEKRFFKDFCGKPMTGYSEHTLYKISMPEDMLCQNGRLLYHARNDPDIGISVISVLPQKVLKNQKKQLR